MRGQAQHRLLGAVVLVLFAVVLARSAWVSDDAFITLRTVDNFLDGRGLRWNPAERVQSYTHPLWMLGLLVAHGVSGEPYYGTLVLGALTSLTAIGVLWFGVARNTAVALTACAPLLWSKAFVDFSTSGLENPLTHLLLALLAISLLRGGDRPRDLFRTALLTALAMLNRLDLAVLFGPALAIHATSVPRTRAHVGALFAGFSPLIAWEAFSFVYYGSLVPNTAYAKLGAGIPRGEMIAQGLNYLAHAISWDRITLVAIACAVIPLGRSRTPPVAALVFGAFGYLVYTVWIGGDFMAGRFLTPPLFAGCLAFAMLDARPGIAAVGVLLATITGGLNPYAPPYAGRDYEKVPAWSGIVDERGYYHRGAGLFASKPPMSHPFAREGRKARRKGRHTVHRAAVGYFGYYAGPRVHIVDPLGLNDPLLSRMPARYNPSWRVGHYRREIPAGYDPGHDIPPTDAELAELYARLRPITRGPLLELPRLRNAADLQLFGPEINPWRWRFPDIVVRSEGETEVRGEVDSRGMLIHVLPPRPVTASIRAPRGQTLRVLYASDDAILAAHDLDGTDALQSLPASRGPVEMVFVFPRRKGARVSIRELELGDR